MIICTPIAVFHSILAMTGFGHSISHGHDSPARTHWNQWPQNCFVAIELRASAALLRGLDIADPMPPGENMKPSTKDEIKGKVHEMKGKVKEKAGQVTNDPNLAAEGQDEKLAGKVQKKVGQVEKVFEK